MIILVLNCGSSSIKYQVIDMDANEHHLLAKGQIERVGLPDSVFTHRPTDRERLELVKDIPDHTAGISLIIRTLTDPKYGVIDNLCEIRAVGHRVAHGGEYFKESAVIDKEVIRKIESCFDLAPLHNPAHMKGILAMENIMPGIFQVAVFDTSFHQSMPPKNFLYALPYKYYEELRVRRYQPQVRRPKGVRDDGHRLPLLEDRHLPHRQRGFGDGDRRRPVVRHFDGLHTG